MHASPRLAAPASSRRITTLQDLRDVQHALAGLARPPARTELVTLPRAVGRIAAADPGPPSLSNPMPVAPGTRLDVRHLPLLCGRGATTTRVHARVRVGVVTLLEGPPDAAPTGPTATATLLAGLVEQLGAQAFEASCRPSVPGALADTLAMFLGDFDLVLFCGFLSPSQCETMRRTLSRDGEDVALQTLRLHPAGALQVARSAARLGVALSADVDSAIAAFALLVSPLIRGLQGRRDRIPAMQVAAAETPGAIDWGFALAREAAGGGGTLLRTCPGADAATRLADADGLAWRPLDLQPREPGALAYYPFARWLA